MAEQYTSPGWYPDPDGKAGERWWNGAGWSDSRRGGAAPVTPVPPPAPSTVYSADHPAPQRPDPYAPIRPVTTSTGITLDMRQNRFATLSLILGIIGVAGFSIAGPAAVVLGFLGIARARRLRAEGAPSAAIVVPAIGLVMGAIATVFLIVAIVAFFAAITFDVS